MSVKRKALLRTDNAPARQSTRSPTREGRVAPDPADIDETVVVANPADFPPDAAPYNLIRSDTLTQPLLFKGPITAAMYPRCLFRVYYDGGLDTAEHEMQPADFENGYISMTLAPEVYAREDGMHTFKWDWKSDTETNFTDPSDVTFFTIDRQKPGVPMLGDIEFPDDVHENGLTDARLTELGNKLPGEVPSYTDRIHGDTAVGIVRNIAGDEERTAPFQIPYMQAGEPVVLEFTREMLARLGDGLLTFTYIVTDLAGNVSDESEPVVIDVFLKPGIPDLDPPLVPLYDDDAPTPPDIKLIDEVDARTPVEVHIPGHPELATGDVFVVWWGTREQPPVIFTGDDASAPVILQIKIPYGEVSGEWADAAQDADGFATIPVNYVVFRANKEVGRPPAPHNVVVNLSQAGGVDPDPETPENEALGFPYVHHSQWNSDRINYIPDASLQEDHEFFVPWFARNPDGTPSGDDAFRGGDDVIVMYNGEVFDERPVSGSDVSAKQDLKFVLPWEVVKAAGSGIKPIQYLAIRYFDDNRRENTSVSPPADVEVEDSSDIPGGPDGLLPARFVADIVRWSEVSVVGHAPLTVKAYEGMRVGDKVRVHVTADEFFPNDQTYGDPYPRAEWGGDQNKHPHPVYPHEIVVTDDNIDTDLTFGWPQELVHWTYIYGMARITYSVTRPDGKRADARAGADQRTDVSQAGQPEPDSYGLTAPRITFSEANRTGARNSPQRMAALNDFASQFRTSRQARAHLRQRRMQAGKVKHAAVAARDDNLTPIQAKLREIAMRPIPKTKRNE
ncbi:hypothetical protein AB870_04610 [Pandoraea faecigallinarum]|uniref:Uncharacterized protein n=2 Tax=Pandoraea faecigallinarum TaxID=656179 RepID=A0A0H3WSN7_9BURK|nr:hypothetical protein AB870_04610 [Pandoraea faecigallinarum]